MPKVLEYGLLIEKSPIILRGYVMVLPLKENFLCDECLPEYHKWAFLVIGIQSIC